MNGKFKNKNITKFSLLILPMILFSGCFSFSFKGSINNVWNVPETNLSVAVEKDKPDVASKEVTRKIILRENHLDKTKIDLKKGLEIYSRINVYQIDKNEYIFKDVFETYVLNTQTKTLTKSSTDILSMTFEDMQYPKFIGAFDDNENGNWRYIPASERAEIR